MTYKIGSKIKFISGFPNCGFLSIPKFSTRLEKAAKKWAENPYTHNVYLIINRSTKTIINPTIKKYIDEFYIIEFEATRIDNPNKFHLICRNRNYTIKY